jgi:hypothetical protein
LSTVAAAAVSAVAKTTLLMGLLFQGSTPLEPGVDPAYKAAWRPEPAILSARAADGDLYLRQASPNGFFFLVGAWSQAEPSAADPAPAPHSVVAVWPKDHRLAPASIVATRALVVMDGLVLEQAVWSQDSRYAAFSAHHEDGLEAWNHPAFVVDAATRKAYPVQALSGPGVGSQLAWADNGDLLVWAGVRDPQGALDPAKRVQVAVPLAKILALDPVGPGASWVSAESLDEAAAAAGSAGCASAAPQAPDGWKGQPVKVFESRSPDGLFALFEAWKRGGADEQVESVVAVWPAKLLPYAVKALDDSDANALRQRSVAAACWSADSRYCAFTTVSPNGHSPWHFPAYVIDTASGALRPVDAVGALVVRPELTLGADGTLTVQVQGPDGSKGVDFEHPVSRTLKLADLMGAKP